jgi:NAD(P)-dependent dehydrogenase (short-subunit alcohol dehydrogenase family)
MYQSLAGKVVFVTGGARRVGRGIALGFAREGARLVIHHSNSDEAAAQTAADIRALGAEVVVVKGDYRKYDDIAANFGQIKARYGRIDVMVNSASNFESGDLLDVSPEDWRKVMSVNLDAPFYCTQFAGRMMRDQGEGGVILNIGDNAGTRAWVKRPHHGVSKAGLLMLTEVTARSLAPYNIRCNALVFGPILKTEGLDDAYWAKVEARLPLKRSGDPDDAARACIFAATNDFMTGAILRVDGGEYLGEATET